jgi:RND family efflux transporter MFP subunit
MKRFSSWLAAALALLVVAVLAIEILRPGFVRSRVQALLSGTPVGVMGSEPHARGQPAQMYYCPMHPSYHSDKPGNCPICNMTLVPMQETATAPSGGIDGHAAITISAARQQLIGVQIGTAERKQFKKTIRAAARVEYDETRLATVTTKVPVWVEALRVKAVGETVAIGARLATIYSPELVEAQRNLLIALEAQASLRADASADGRAFADANVAGAKDRLLQLDLTAEQVEDLAVRREVSRAVELRARAQGVVTKRLVTAGSYLEAGAPLFELADLSRVWVIASIYEIEAGLVRAGMEARVQLLGETVSAPIAYVYPSLDAASRTLAVRIEVANPDGWLKPGMYATAELDVDLGERLVVDDQAVLYSGLRHLVFVVKDEGDFEPREVEVGPRANGVVAIERGLEPGERVVVSGNFLVDSESRLKSALLQGPEGGGHRH